MDAESWFNAKKAVELGFADKLLFLKRNQKGRRKRVGNGSSDVFHEKR